MTETSCPICKMNTYLNPDMKLFISPCYHRICETCLNRLYTHFEIKCFECNTLLRKSSYITQVFEDIDVERECKLRKLLIPYILTQDNFKTVIDYYDYLEMVEDVIENLIESKCGLNDSAVTNVVSKFKNEHETKQQIIKLENVDVNNVGIESKQDNRNRGNISNLVYDPFEDVELECIRLNVKPKIPKWFAVNFLASGFTEHIIVYKSVYSLYDDKI